MLLCNIKVNLQHYTLSTVTNKKTQERIYNDYVGSFSETLQFVHMICHLFNYTKKEA
jgi:hypothetical protein